MAAIKFIVVLALLFALTHPALAQTSCGANCFNGGYGANGGIGGTGPNQPGSDNVVQGKNYGMKCDNSTDDYAAAQAALNAGCQIPALGSPPVSINLTYPVVFPAGICRISQPLRPTCAGLQWYGAGENATTISPTYTGPAVLDEEYGFNNLNLTTSLLTGSGNAMVLQSQSGCSPAATCGSIPLNEVIGYMAANKLNGLAAFNVEVVFKPSTCPTAGGTFNIIGSHPGQGSATNNGVFNLNSDTLADNEIFGRLNVAGTVKNITGPALTCDGSTTYDLSLDYDGAHVTLCTGTPGNATTCTSTAATGTLTQDPYEVAMLPDTGTNYFPDAQNAINHVWTGTIDSIRISNISRHQSTYTAPTAKLGADANTLLYIPFITSGYVSDGLQQVQTGASGTQYVAVRGGNGAGEVPQQYVHDLGFTGPFVAIWSWQSTFQRLKNQHGSYPQETAGFNFYDNDFLDNRTDLLSVGYPIGIEYGVADNESVNINNQVGEGTTYSCFVAVANGGQTDIHPLCGGGGELIHPWLYYGTTALLDFPFTDFEDTESLLTDIFYLSGNRSVTINLPQITTVSTAPTYFAVNAGGPIEIHNPELSGTSNEIIHVINSPTVPVSIDGIDNSQGASLGPVSDSLGDVVTPGCGGKVTLVGGSGTIAFPCLSAGSTGCAGIDLTTQANAVTVAGGPFSSAAPVAITGASESSTTGTFVTGARSPEVLFTGQRVVVAGVTPSGYNGSWVVASTADNTHFTATLVASGLGAGTVFGTATPKGSVAVAGTGTDVVKMTCQ